MQNGQTQQEKYQFFNLHPQSVMDAITHWLHDETGKSLVLTGEAGSGRSYIVKAACLNAVYNKRPFQVVSIGSELMGDDIPAITRYIEQEFKLQDKQYANAWQSMLNAIDNVGLPNYHGIGVVMKLAATLKLFSEVRDFFVEQTSRLPDTSPHILIQEVLEQLVQTHNIVLHLISLYKSQGQYEAAEPLYQRAIAIMQTALPKGHPSLDIVKKNYEGMKAVMTSSVNTGPVKEKNPAGTADNQQVSASSNPDYGLWLPSHIWQVNTGSVKPDK